MENIQYFLRLLGLSELEISIFLCCAKYTSLSVTSLARLLNTPRTTIHDHVERLTQKQFLLTKQDSKGKTYTAANIDQMLWLLHTKRDDLDQLLQQEKLLKMEFSQLTAANSFLPKITYHQGIDAIYMVYSKIAKADEVCCFFDIDACMQYTQWDRDRMCALILDGKTKSKEILLHSENALYYQQKVNGVSGHQVKLLPVKEPLYLDTGLIDGTCYHITFGEIITVLEIENPVFYASQKILFDSLRERL